MEIGDLSFLPHHEEEVPFIYLGKRKINGQEVDQFVEVSRYNYGYPINGSEELRIVWTREKKDETPLEISISPDSERHSRLIQKLKQMGIPVK